MSTNNFLTNDEIIKLIKEHQEKKKDNSGILIKNYDKLLYKYASAFTHNKTFEYDDLIQEASIALIKAIDKFDINSEFKFITFASSYIKCQLLSYVNRQNLLYTPHNSKNKINRYLKQINELHIKLERKPTHEEILSLTNYSLKEIKFYEKQIALSTSLYMTTGDETMDDIISYIPDSQVDIEDAYQHVDTKNYILKLIDTMLNSNILNENEKNTLILKHGLHNNKEHSLREIGIKLNLSHQRIATILSDSYKKIRNSNYINEFSEVTDYKIKKQQN